MRENGACLLLGTLSQFEHFLPRLKGDDIGLQGLAQSIETALRNHNQALPSSHRGLHLEQAPLLMGVLNVTPDSFSDAGSYKNVDAAVMQALDMVARGASLVDIGGESSRPGAVPVDESEELNRVMPVVRALARPLHGRVSVDTRQGRGGCSGAIGRCLHGERRHGAARGRRDGGRVA